MCFCVHPQAACPHVRITLAAMALPIVPWSFEDQDSFLERWAEQIATMDNSGGNSLWIWLLCRVRQVVATARQPSRNMYFGSPALANQFLFFQPVGAVCWTDGRRGTQQLPRRREEVESRWWPCLVVVREGDCWWPFYCPALAWQWARPWSIHRSRVFLLRDRLAAVEDGDADEAAALEEEGADEESDEEEDGDAHALRAGESHADRDDSSDPGWEFLADSCPTMTPAAPAHPSLHASSSIRDDPLGAGEIAVQDDYLELDKLD